MPDSSNINQRPHSFCYIQNYNQNGINMYFAEQEFRQIMLEFGEFTELELQIAWALTQMPQLELAIMIIREGDIFRHQLNERNRLLEEQNRLYELQAQLEAELRDLQLQQRRCSRCGQQEVEQDQSD